MKESEQKALIKKIYLLIERDELPLPSRSVYGLTDARGRRRDTCDRRDFRLDRG